MQFPVCLAFLYLLVFQWDRREMGKIRHVRACTVIWHHPGHLKSAPLTSIQLISKHVPNMFVNQFPPAWLITALLLACTPHVFPETRDWTARFFWLLFQINYPARKTIKSSGCCLNGSWVVSGTNMASHKTTGKEKLDQAGVRGWTSVMANKTIGSGKIIWNRAKHSCDYCFFWNVLNGVFSQSEGLTMVEMSKNNTQST